MIFSKTNAWKNNTRDVYLHDDVFIGFRFDRAAYKAVLLCSNQTKGDYEVSFCGVIGIEMTSCDFWGPSPHIDTFRNVETNEQVLIPKLKEEYVQYSTPNDLPFINDSYIETVLSLISGDHFRIACKTIQIEYINQGTVNAKITCPG